MASSSPQVYPKKTLKGLESRKSNSWWWDSHIGPRNMKWLAENLEDMDQNYKRMLTLIEGDGDSLAKKADMYYQKRPVLVSHVEEFYRTYKTLAERYEHLTGDMKKHLLPEVQAQGSGGWDSALDPKLGRRGSGHRAAGFDFFLGSARIGLDRPFKEDETPSISDSETESDVSSLYSYSGVPVTAGEPEVESLIQESDYKIGSFRRSSSENFDDIYSKISGYEEELRMAKEKIHQSEEEIAILKGELNKSKSFLEIDAENIPANHESIYTVDVDESRLQALDKEVIRLRKENMESTESIRRMHDLLKMAQKEVATYKGKLETEKRVAAKLHERFARHKMSLTEREKEVRELKEVISDPDRQIQLHAEISRLVNENNRLEERLRESEMHCHSLESQHETLVAKLNGDLDAFKVKYDTLVTLKDEVDIKIEGNEDQIAQLLLTIAENEVTVEELRAEIERQKDLILEAGEAKREAIRQLCYSLEHYRIGYQQLRQTFTVHNQHHVFAS